MIQQRAASLEALIARQRELGAQVRQLEGFRGQEQEVKKVVEKLSPLMSTLRMFRARRIGGTESAVQAAGVLQPLTLLREAYERDRSSILGPNRLTSVRAIGTLTPALQTQLLAAWRQYAQAQIPSVNSEVLMVLSRIAALKPDVDALGRGLRDLGERMGRLPLSDTDIDEFEALARSVRSLWEAFDSTHIPPEVLSFLKEASSGGAALDTLSEGVRSWLRDKQLINSFRIRSIASTNVSG